MNAFYAKLSGKLNGFNLLKASEGDMRVKQSFSL